MRFSVIVPVYNSQTYLRECLASVLEQDYRDFELIVVDDGSTDESASIAEHFAANDERVQVLREVNRGPFLARRRGLALCQGDYVVFLDADDALARNALARISKEIDDTGADIISFRFSRRTSFSRADDVAPIQPGIYRGNDYENVKRVVLGANYNNLCGKAFRLCCIDADATYEGCEGFVLAEDLLQLLPIADSATSLARIDDALYYYRSNDTSSTGTYKHSYLINSEHVAKRLLGYGDKWGMPSVALDGALMLYINLLRLLVRNGSSNQVKAELPLIAESLHSLSSYVEDGIRKQRPDLRILLHSAFIGSIRKVVFSVRFTDLARRLTGHK